MKTNEIIQIAHGTLVRRRADIVAAVGAAWQAECVRELQIATGLKLDDTQTSCEVSFRAIYGGPNDLGPTRAIWAEAQRLASNSEAADLLVDHWLTHLPSDPRGDDLFNALGMYFAEDRVVQGRAELYWARIAGFSVRSKPMSTPVTAEAVAKVVMLHELAHYVTHQGCYKGRHWERFPSGQDVVEIVAQVATEDVIRRLNDGRLLAAFECLLENAPAKYSAHRKIVEKLRSEFAEGTNRPELVNFWDFFRSELREPKKELASVEAYIEWVKTLTTGEHGLDLTF
jgi:hypothetical protein